MGRISKLRCRLFLFLPHRCEVEQHAWSALTLQRPRIEKRIGRNPQRTASTKDCSVGAGNRTTAFHQPVAMRGTPASGRNNMPKRAEACYVPQCSSKNRGSHARTSPVGPTGKVPNNLPSRSPPTPADAWLRRRNDYVTYSNLATPL